MSPEKIIFLISVFVVITSTLWLIYSRLPKRLKHDKFYDKWKSIQKKCSDKESWKEAIIEADNLVDEVLKKKKFKGNSMGERLVNAEKQLGKHESVWFGHKLRKKLETDPNAKLNKDDTKEALLGFGQALKDLGALK